MKPWLATMPGPCRRCGRTIEIGQELVPRNGYWCRPCADAEREGTMLATVTYLDHRRRPTGTAAGPRRSTSA